MSNVQMYERATASFAAGLAKRGHHIVYRTNESNHCPGCGRSHWHIGRVTAECGFCGTAVPLAETTIVEAATPTARPKTASSSPDERRFPRMAAKGRKLKLLVDGSPASFALHDISEGGAKGQGPGELVPGAKVHVRFEGGILVPAVVKWTENGLLGLAFIDPVILDRSTEPRN
jgi:PilZ domain